MPAAKPPEYLRRALDLLAEGNPTGQIAKHLAISKSCLRRCMSIDDVDAGRKEGLTRSEREELVQLRRQNRVLEMELEILKRAGAYFASDTSSHNDDPTGQPTSRGRDSCRGNLPDLRSRPVDVLRDGQAMGIRREKPKP